MAGDKPFLSYGQQVDLLRSRGMQISDPGAAEIQLRRLNYYRLSGYWHPMKELDVAGDASNRFRRGATFELAVELHDFDLRLRGVILKELAKIELAMRTALGHELGRVHPFIHEDSQQLSPVAREKARRGQGTLHSVWISKLKKAVGESREDFVKHHKSEYRGQLPIWAAVEVMDWGMLSYLYRMAPTFPRDEIAGSCNLTAPQLESWLRTLNVLRNLAAHHSRVFNRVFEMKPKLSNAPELVGVEGRTNRLFGQLTLVQYLHRELELSNGTELPRILECFPHNSLVPFGRTGAPENWRELELWNQDISAEGRC